MPSSPIVYQNMLSHLAAPSMVVPNNIIRRGLALDGRGPYETRAMLEAAKGHADFAYLETFGLRRRHAVRPVCDPPDGCPDFSDLESLIDGTHLNSLFLLGRRGKHPLSAFEWRDAYFAYAESRWTIFGPDWVDPLSTGLPSPGAVEAARNGDATAIGQLNFCGDVFGANNPGHFINDVVPRALQFRDQLKAAPSDIYVPQTTAQICEMAVNIVTPGAQFLEPNRLYRCDHLALLSSVRQHGHPLWYLDPRVVEPVTTAFRAAGAAGAGQGRAIYLHRLNDWRRPLEHEQDLMDTLADMGFANLSMGALSAPDQMAAMHHADVIVSQHGGQLGSLPAARPGATLVEFFPPRIGTMAYSAVARGCGLTYEMILGGDVAEGLAWKTDFAPIIDAARRALGG